MRHVSQVFLSAEVPRVGELSCGGYWNGLRNPTMATVGLEWPRSMTDEGTVTEDMTISLRAVQPWHLAANYGLREQPVRDIAERQDRRWWTEDAPAHSSCVLTSTNDEPWLMVSKTQIPPAPPVLTDTAHLLIRLIDPKREPAFAADLDDEYAELKTSATYTVAKVVDDWDAEAMVKPTNKTVRSHVDPLRPVTMLIGNIP